MSVTFSISPTQKRELTCFHCKKVSVFLLKRDHVDYSFKEEADFWKKRFEDTSKKLAEYQAMLFGKDFHPSKVELGETKPE